jgi:hypothetical protein
LEEPNLRHTKCVRLEDSGIPIQPHVITLPPRPVEGIELKKGPITAPTPIEGTELEKGPITAPAPAPTPPPLPAQPTVTVELDVEVYDDPSDNKQKIGELIRGTPGVFLAEPCRADHWCHVKGNVPTGMGWVWSGPGYESLKF